MNEKPRITKQPPTKFWFPHLLKAMQELGGTANAKDARQKTVSFFDVDDALLEEKTKETKDPTLLNNIGWAKNYLTRADYIYNLKYGVWGLTPKAKEEMPTILDLIGKDFSGGMGGYTDALASRKINVTQLIDNIDKAARKELKHRRLQNQQQSINKQDISVKNTKEDSIDNEKSKEEDKIQKEEDNKLQKELDVIINMNPLQFERLCVQIFKELGYENVEPTKQSRDGGYDGVGYLVSGLVRFKVVFQAKRYAQDNKISGPNISEFLGTMDAPVNAEKGVFITTSYFSPDAQKRATALGGRIALVNGEDLIKLLREYRIGYVEEIVINPDFFKNL